MSTSSILNHETGSTTITGSQSKNLKNNMPPLPNDRSSTINEKSITGDKQNSAHLHDEITHLTVF